MWCLSDFLGIMVCQESNGCCFKYLKKGQSYFLILIGFDCIRCLFFIQPWDRDAILEFITRFYFLLICLSFLYFYSICLFPLLSCRWMGVTLWLRVLDAVSVVERFVIFPSDFFTWVLSCTCMFRSYIFHWLHMLGSWHLNIRLSLQQP